MVKVNDNADKIYDRIRKLRNGNIEQRRLAIECEKILSNPKEESLTQKFRKIYNLLNEFDKR